MEDLKNNKTIFKKIKFCKRTSVFMLKEASSQVVF